MRLPAERVRMCVLTICAGLGDAGFSGIKSMSNFAALLEAVGYGEWAGRQGLVGRQHALGLGFSP